ncbi:MAG: methyltransferase domain-containing protein [Rhodobacterales bacterium]|nr:methyltransferase domain-containing protein [Rhodobacterales bacterium]
MSAKYTVLEDPEYGYKRLDPLPSDPDISKFYQSRYYDLIREGGRAPEIGRLMAGGQAAQTERSWLHQTLYSDIVQTLDAKAPGKRTLDVGAGTGELVAFLNQRGHRAEGVDPSEDAAGLALEKGLTVYATDLQAFSGKVQSGEQDPFDGVVMVNVLEHVPHPADILRAAHGVLNENGVLCVRVPNDFTELQSAAEQVTGARSWWVATPDHINYFDYASLGGLFERCGFEVVDVQSDWPMEMFLLMGKNYVDNPEVGGACHRERVAMELALPQSVRRKLYRSFARAGFGRNCLMFGRKKTP